MDTATAARSAAAASSSGRHDSGSGRRALGDRSEDCRFPAGGDHGRQPRRLCDRGGRTFTPDTFACGVDLVGPSNMVSFLNTFPAYWVALLEKPTRQIGDHRTEEGRAFLTERPCPAGLDRLPGKR